MNTPTPTPLTDAEECEAITGLGRCVGVNFARTLERELTTLTAERDQLRAEVERLKTCGIVEIAASNSSVLDYCKHREGRAERAEAELAEMHNEVAGGSAAGQRLEEWLCGITEALRELPQVKNATSVHLWNLRAAYFNTKPPLTRDDTLLNAARAKLIALRAENTTLRAAQKACEACDEPTAFEVRQLRAELAAEREKAERYRLVTLRQDVELAKERARLDWLESRSSTVLFRYSVGGWSISDDAEKAQNLLHEYTLYELRAAIDAGIKEGAK